MKFSEIPDGRSVTVAVDEIRAGISELDPRGVWALGQVGSSVMARHGISGDAGVPNSDNFQSYDIMGCKALTQFVGIGTLAAAGMPCFAPQKANALETNSQAGARSMHPSGVHVLMIGGSVKFIANDVDPLIWHAIHTRDFADNAEHTQF